MSKCELVIAFDRQDRQYRSGETVTGEVVVRPLDDINCEKITLEHFWRTHGRGNTDQGEHFEEMLHDGRLEAGREYRFPFQFMAPAFPLTYRGHDLNIDHYVHARVHIDWAFDVKATEEFLVIPGVDGEVQAGRLPSGQRTLRATGGKGRGVSIPALIFGVVLIAIGVMTLIVLIGIVFIAVGLLVIFSAFRNTLATRRLGEVTITGDCEEVAEGESAELILRFAPTKQVTINSVVASLRGYEQCVSGSGTDRTTHTHKLHQQAFRLSESATFPLGKPIEIAGWIEIPSTQAYSFAAGDNQIIWEVSVKIDIPNWPDWKHTFPVIVHPRDGFDARPAAHFDERTQAIDAVRPSPEPIDIAVEDVAPAPIVDEPASPAVEQPVVGPPPPIRDDPSLSQLIESMAATGTFSEEREQIVARNRGRAFRINLKVDRVEWTFSPDCEALVGGRTIVGEIVRDDRSEGPTVAIRFPSQFNQQIDPIARDTILPVSCVLSDWNGFYERAVFDADELSV